MAKPLLTVFKDGGALKPGTKLVPNSIDQLFVIFGAIVCVK